MNKHLQLLQRAREIISDRQLNYVCDAIGDAAAEFGNEDSMSSCQDLWDRIGILIEHRWSLDRLWCERNPEKFGIRICPDRDDREYWDFFLPMRLDLIDQLMEEFK